MKAMTTNTRYFERIDGVAAGSVITLKVIEDVICPASDIPPGTEGDDLFRLQQCLAYLELLDASKVDGRWDDETDAAIRTFQKSAGLKEDAWYGKATRSALTLAIGEEIHEQPDPKEQEAIAQTPPTRTPNTPTTSAPSGRLFPDVFEIVDANALLRDANLKSTGEKLPPGTRVYVVGADRTYVKIATAPGSSLNIRPADNVWTAFSNLGGRGADVPLGNEKTDAAAKRSADSIRASLPAGRKVGQSPYIWRFANYFQPSLDGKTLEPTLMTKVWRLMQWAVYNDMTTGDIVIGDGVRSPKTAHRMCVAWEIQYGPGRVTFEAVKALPGGKDGDGNLWYRSGWTWAQVKANAKEVRASSAIAAAGHEFGDSKRAPLPLNSRPGVSRHCTGRAVDVTIKWRKQGVSATTNQNDVWGWETINNQFGLFRPLPKGHPNQENWHLEEKSGTTLAPL